ncbi:unnamed protein product [Anisakis simplex]|uniref:3'-5' exonuclease domain-containing protein n=1 Tax=Anisakis simplex TaxID=6269 RepID=A0A0M3K3I8_ANISI|nr:unnamed protein product [Anisakis simplex]
MTSEVANAAENVDNKLVRSLISDAYDYTLTLKPSKGNAVSRHLKYLSIFSSLKLKLMGGFSDFEAYGRIETVELPSVFVAVIREFEVYAGERSGLDAEHDGVHVLDLIANCFLELMIVHGKKLAKKKSGPTTSIFPLSKEERINILKALIPYEFSSSNSFWKKANFALGLFTIPQLVVSTILQAVKEGWASFISVKFIMHESRFSSYIKDPSILRYAAFMGALKPSTVEQFAALNRSTPFRTQCKKIIYELEEIAGSKERWTLEKDKIRMNSSSYRQYLGRKPFEYNDFKASINYLVKSLKGEEEIPSDDRIDLGWARVAIKKSAARHYLDGTWKAENMHEVLWTICVQRPELRTFVFEHLIKKYNQVPEAHKWKTFKAARYNRTEIKSKFDTIIDPLTANPPFVSFPACVNSITMVDTVDKLKVVEDQLYNCSIGNYPFVGIDAEWSSYVSFSKATIFQLAFRTEVFVVDLDAFGSKAASQALSSFFDKLFHNDAIKKIGYHFTEDLIQLRHAVTKSVALYHPANLICIDRLVQVLKTESIKQKGVDLEGVFWPLRKCELEGSEQLENTEEVAEEPQQQTPDSDSNGIALGQENEIEQNANCCEEEGSNHLLMDPANDLQVAQDGQTSTEMCGDKKMASEEKGTEMNVSDMEEQSVSSQANHENEVTESRSNIGKQEPKDENERRSQLERPIRGLSALCECVLGKALDKSEQCSVWDRRPLRCLQLRYAALDAYCMLMLFDQCVEWSKRLNMDINEVCNQQGQIRCHLPLLWEDEGVVDN